MSKLATNKFKWTFSSTDRETTRFGIVMIKSSVFCQSPFKIKFFATNITVYVHQHDFPAQSRLKRFVHNVDSQFALEAISWCGFEIPHLRGRSHYIFFKNPSYHQDHHLHPVCPVRHTMAAMYSTCASASSPSSAPSSRSLTQVGCHCTANPLWPFTDCNFT